MSKFSAVGAAASALGNVWQRPWDWRRIPLKSLPKMNAGEQKPIGGSGLTPELFGSESGYDSLFSTATGPEKPLKPFAYQIHLACGENARLEAPGTLKRGCDCRSLLINVPTGLGKTAAVVPASFWKPIR